MDCFNQDYMYEDCESALCVSEMMLVVVGRGGGGEG